MEKQNGGAIFYNTYKKADNHPDWKGTADYNGVQFEIALWERKDKNGKTYFSVKTSEPYKKQETNPQSVTNLNGIDNEKDPLPF